MKLLLDEMFLPVIAVQLRARGHDVEATAERSDCRGQSDEFVFLLAQDEGRAIVTENVVDFRPLANQALRTGRGHAGMIFTLHRVFPRSDPRTLGRLVTALDAFLRKTTAGDGLEFWLSPADLPS